MVTPPKFLEYLFLIDQDHHLQWEVMVNARGAFVFSCNDILGASFSFSAEDTLALLEHMEERRATITAYAQAHGEQEVDDLGGGKGT